MKRKSIGVFGLWHLGCVYAASLASNGFNVTGFDFDKKVTSNLKKNIPPIFEPKLKETLRKFNHKNLYFTNSEKEFFEDIDYIFITHDIPVDENDNLQMDVINKTFAIIPKYLSSKTTIVISSQIPVGTSRKLTRLLKKNHLQNPVIYFPENLRLGQAFDSFLTPDRIILGSADNEVLDKFKEDFSFFKCPIITMGLESAEMTKHALNCYLATCISFSSEISDLAEKVGANMLDIVSALKTDKRVSPFTPINPGIGFAGGTLGRDIQTLKNLSKKFNYHPKLLNAIYSVNQDRIPLLVSKIKSLFPSLKGKVIGILGLTYKPNTDTLRRSMSLELISQLKKTGIIIKAFDPTIRNKIKNYPFVEICTDIKTFLNGLNIIILMTEWPEFGSIDPKQAATLVRNKNIIDTKNFLNKNLYEKEGFNVLRIGEG